jgi:four helix bundle protein
MHNFKELNVWKDAMKIAKDIFSLTKKFPSEEKFGLTSQMNRCAVSCPSNIAEGAGRNSNKEFQQYLSIALGSSYELETQLILSHSFNYLDEAIFNELLTNINRNQKMIVKFRESLSKTS